MAVQNEINLKGKLNNLVFYTSGGKHLVRSMPATVQQSANTLVRSRNFGLAAAAGRLLRSYLAGVIPYPKDRKMQNHFTGAIARGLALTDTTLTRPDQLPAALIGFSFNTAAELGKSCKIAVTVSSSSSGELHISLPAFVPAQAFAAPRGTEQVQVSFSLAACGLLQSQARKGYTQELLVPYHQPLQAAQTLQLPAGMQDGDLLVLVAAIRFINGEGHADSRAAFLPAEVIWAGYC